MTLREDMIADGQAAWFETDGLAQTVVYRAGGAGAGAAIPALVLCQENPREDSRFYRAAALITVQAADVPAPAPGDTFTLGTDIWTLRSITAGNGIHWQLNCTGGVRPVLRQRQP